MSTSNEILELIIQEKPDDEIMRDLEEYVRNQVDSRSKWFSETRKALDRYKQGLHLLDEMIHGMARTQSELISTAKHDEDQSKRELALVRLIGITESREGFLFRRAQLLQEIRLSEETMNKLLNHGERIMCPEIVEEERIKKVEENRKKHAESMLV